jgi:hypothetical protein
VDACPQPSNPTPTPTPPPTPTPTPEGGVAAESDQPTLPPTDAAVTPARAAANTAWQAPFLLLTGLVAFGLLATTRRPIIHRND